MLVDLGIDDVRRHDRGQHGVAQPGIGRGVVAQDVGQRARVDRNLVVRIGLHITVAGECLPQADMPACDRPWISARDSMATTRGSAWKARLPITLLTP